MKKVVVIFIDAFSSQYLTKQWAPFLYELYQEGCCKNIEPLPAFEGIGATIFSGTWPRTNGIWTNFIRRKQSQAAFLEFTWCSLLKVLNLIPSDRLAWDFRYITYKLLKKPVPIQNLTPPDLLRFFQSKLETSVFRDNALGNIPTLFDVVRETGRTITFINTLINQGNDEKIAAKTIAYLRQGKVSPLTYLKFSSLDLIGHRFGPESKITRERVRVIDGLIDEIIQEAKGRDEITFLIFSDHGMTPVTEWIDVLKLLGKTGLKIGKDYLVFLDSTMARFWFNAQSAGNIIEMLLSDLKCGFLLSDDNLKKANLPVNKEEYGELIFALKEGAVISPDFFHKNTLVKGMHSYYASEYDCPIFAISPYFNIKRDTIKFTDIMPTVLKLLEIPPPQSCEGESAIQV